MQLLPLELKHLIVELSSGSPNSLAALARTHTAYRSEAERVLYDTLTIYGSSDDSLKCMKTLATNPEKAALVRFLTIDLGYSRDKLIDENIRKVMTYLSNSLINMHSLSDFRVKSRAGDNESEMKDLDNILWSVCIFLII